MAPALLVLSLLTLAAPPALQPGRHYLWLETEQFKDLGGWQIDSQFVDQMGSSYLLAQGLHAPVADAGTTARVPAAGHYRAWARTRDWVPMVEPSPGRYSLRLGGGESPVLGADKRSAWHWQAAGAYDLPAGDVRVALHDLSGEYGRCDALLLSDDATFTPGDDATSYHDLRQALTGVDGTFQTQGDYDVVVVGGGLAGTFAALSAARHGARTALIQDRPMLGGNASDEVHVGPAGATANAAPNSRETGLAEEGWRAAVQQGSWSKGLDHLAAAQANLTTVYWTRVQGVEKAADGTIAAVTGRHVLTGQGVRYRGKLFIDCTGDGNVGAYAGCEFRMGREARAEFGESMAPETADKYTQGTSLLYGFSLTDAPVAFRCPNWANQFKSRADLPFRDPGLARFGHWWIELGGDRDTIADHELIRDNLLRALYGVVDYVKNQSPEKAAAARFRLEWVSTVGGKRESRRLVGDYILKEQDVKAATVFPDRVAFGGWTIDIHPPHGIFDPEPPCIQVPVPLYSIPFRSLYSKDVANLLMAGRDLSATHVALGTTRVMLTCGTQGQAVGTAAALCLKYGQTPRQLCQTHIVDLQNALARDDANLLSFTLKEPDNLAQQATITASSSVAEQPYTRDNVLPREKHKCDHFRSVLLPRSANRVETAWAYLGNESDRPVKARLALRNAPKLGQLAGTEVATAEAEVKPGRGWVKFSYQRDLPPGEGLWFVLSPAEGLFWYLASAGPAGSSRGYASPKAPETWVPNSECYALVTEPSSLRSRGAEPAAVADGLLRPQGSDYCGWTSDPTQKLPQWLELHWPEPRKVGRVELVFDTNLTQKVPNTLTEKEVVTDYRLEALQGTAWVTVAEVKGNWQRLRQHEFTPVTAAALRLVVTSTGGDPAARVMELRAYER